MTSSTLVKGAGVLSGTIGVPAAAVGIHKYVTSLYEVEQKLIDEDFKLTVTNDATNKKITVKAPDSESKDSNPKLGEGYSWTCEISVQLETSESFPAYLEGIIKKKLPGGTTQTDANQKQNKEALVRACAQDRKEKSSNVVKGQLTLVKKKANTSDFTFQDHSHLDVLLENDLFEVEQEAIDKSVQVSVGEPVSDKITITAAVNTDSNSVEDKLAVGHAWSCEITVEPKGASNTENVTTVKGKLSTKFPTSKSTNHKDLITLLVKACAKNRASGASNTTVKGQLSVKANTTGGNTTYSVENNPELNTWINN